VTSEHKNHREIEEKREREKRERGRGTSKKCVVGSFVRG